MACDGVDAVGQFGEAVGVEAVAGAGSFDLALDEAGFSEDAEVFGDGGLGELEWSPRLLSDMTALRLEGIRIGGREVTIDVADGDVEVTGADGLEVIA